LKRSSTPSGFSVESINEFSIVSSLDVVAGRRFIIKNLSIGQPTGIDANWVDVSGQWGGTAKALSAASSRRDGKTDFLPLPLSLLNTYNLLNPLQYTWKSDMSSLDFGFIADEVAQVHPYLAKWGENTKWNEEAKTYDNEIINDDIIPVDINVRGLLSLTVAKVQQLEKEIKKLQTELNNLKNK
jgi:hypothetical protein